MNIKIKSLISLVLVVIMVVSVLPFAGVSANDTVTSYDKLTSTLSAGIVTESGNSLSARTINDSPIVMLSDVQHSLIEKDGDEWVKLTIAPGDYGNNGVLIKIALHELNFNAVENKYMKIVYYADYDKTMDLSANPYTSPNGSKETWLSDASHPVAKSGGKVTEYIVDLTKLNAKIEITEDYTNFSLVLKIFGSGNKTVEKESNLYIKYIAFCKTEEEARTFTPVATSSAVLTAAKADSVISEAAKYGAKYIDVSFKGTPGTTNGNITLAKEFISGVDSKLKDVSVNVISDDVKITLDSAVIKELAALSSDIEFAFAKDGDAVKITALSNGKEIKINNKVRVLIYAATGDTTAVATVNGKPVVDSGIIAARPALKTSLPATVGYKTQAYAEFSDTAGHWGNSYIKFVSARSLFNGVTETEFAPNGTMTRAMAATVLMRISGDNVTGKSHTYTDVSADAWYANAVEWAYANKISDTDSDKFRPDDPITREELASFIYNYANAGKASAPSSFTDAASISPSYKDAVDYCVEKKIINGYDDGSFKPQNKASRAEVSTMISRFINSQLKANEVDIMDYQNVDFDENNIVLTFLSVSDIHIDSASLNGAAKNYKNALDNAYKFAKTGDLDLVFAAGDLVQNLCYDGDYLHEIKAFKSHSDNFLRDDTALVYCTGNHDRSGSVHFEKEFIEAFTATDADKEKYFRFDVEDPDPTTGNRHAVVNGYHFLSVGMYQDYTAYLKPRLDEITAAEPDKPVFVQYHYHASDTVYASQATKNYGELKLRELLDNYPQVIFFSGHTHNGLENPRAIWQDTFTALDTASVRYLDDNSLINWEFKIPANATHSEVFEYASEATLVEVDANNNVRFKAFNTYRGDIVNEFVVAAPNSDNTHLLTYTDDREAYSMPPEFSADAKLYLTKNAGGTCKVNFTQATHDDIVWYYSITFEAEGEKITKYLTSRYYDPNGMPDTLNVTIAGLTVGKTYTVTLTPYDVWDRAGEPIVKEYTA